MKGMREIKSGTATRSMFGCSGGWKSTGQVGGWARFSVTGWAHEGQRRAMKRENLCMLIRLKADLKLRFGADWKTSPA
jgi:hypothetical protein